MATHQSDSLIHGAAAAEAREECDSIVVLIAGSMICIVRVRFASVMSGQCARSECCLYPPLQGGRVYSTSDWTFATQGQGIRAAPLRWSLPAVQTLFRSHQRSATGTFGLRGRPAPSAASKHPCTNRQTELARVTPKAEAIGGVQPALLVFGP